jgi:hypothetical protein
MVGVERFREWPAVVVQIQNLGFGSRREATG